MSLWGMGKGGKGLEEATTANSKVRESETQGKVKRLGREEAQGKWGDG